MTSIRMVKQTNCWPMESYPFPRQNIAGWRRSIGPPSTMPQICQPRMVMAIPCQEVAQKWAERTQRVDRAASFVMTTRRSARAARQLMLTVNEYDITPNRHFRVGSSSLDQVRPCLWLCLEIGRAHV